MTKICRGISQLDVSDRRKWLYASILTLGEAFDYLLHWRAHIGPVGEDDVDVVVLQTLQGALEALNHVLLAEAASVGLLASCAKEDLCRKDVLVARPGELLEGVAHLDLRLTVSIGLRCVEEVDSVVPCGFQALLDDVALEWMLDWYL
jgi:hypothetical protein